LISPTRVLKASACRLSAGHDLIPIARVRQAAALAQGITNLLPQLGALSVILPPETLAWKLRMLDTGNKFIADRLGTVSQRVLLLVGDGDLLLPSGAEGKRLARMLPRCVSKVIFGHLRVPSPLPAWQRESSFKGAFVCAPQGLSRTICRRVSLQKHLLSSMSGVVRLQATCHNADGANRC